MMMVFANRVLFNLKIDDPVDAISIHFVIMFNILGLRNAWSQPCILV
jgi:ammonia channel protein AmtB